MPDAPIEGTFFLGTVEPDGTIDFTHGAHPSSGDLSDAFAAAQALANETGKVAILETADELIGRRSPA